MQDKKSKIELKKIHLSYIFIYKLHPSRICNPQIYKFIFPTFSIYLLQLIHVIHHFSKFPATPFSI